MPDIQPVPTHITIAAEVPLQTTSLEIWRQKYCLRDQDDKPANTDYDGYNETPYVKLGNVNFFCDHRAAA